MMSVLAQMKRQLGSSSSSKNIKVLDLDVISGQPMKQIATSPIKTKRAKHMEVKILRFYRSLHAKWSKINPSSTYI